MVLIFRVSTRGIVLKMFVGLIKPVEKKGFRILYKLRHIIVCVNIRTDSEKTLKSNSRPQN